MIGGVVAGAHSASDTGRPAETANLVCDLDGVIYLGEQAIPGAGEALTRIERGGFRVLLVTNNSTRTPSAVAEHVAAVSGYKPRLEHVLSSGQATAQMLAESVRVAFVVGEDGLRATLEENGIATTSDWRKADAVVVGLDRRVDYGAIRDAGLAVRSGARFVATNVDPTYPTPEGLWPGGGAIAAAIAAAAGAEPEVAGKPYPAMRALVRGALAPGPTWVVGDRADTDLELGRLEGWSRVLVLSGATTVAPTGDRAPELVLPSIAALPDVLLTQG